MTTDEWIQHINHSIARAVEHDSGIDASVLDVHGFSTGIMRRLVNNLLSEGRPLDYMEVGCYFGGTACAAINNNPNIIAHLFENGSQEFDGRPILSELKGNLARHGSKYTLFETDFFASHLYDLPTIDVFFYDGNHDEQWQAKALPHAFSALADTFLYVVDDASWKSVIDGTAQGFMDLHGKMEILHEWNLRGAQKDNDPAWHNGVDLFLCRKL